MYFLAVEVGDEEGGVLGVRHDLGLNGLSLRLRDLLAAALVVVELVLRRPGGCGGLVQRERRAVVRSAHRAWPGSHRRCRQWLQLQEG